MGNKLVFVTRPISITVEHSGIAKQVNVYVLSNCVIVVTMSAIQKLISCSKLSIRDTRRPGRDLM